MLQYKYSYVMTRKWIAGSSATEIAAAIERGIHGGRADPGHALPTVRDLATTLRVSPATVAAAYKLLRARGLIAGQGRQGTRVSRRPPAPVGSASAPVAAGTIDLATGNPDSELLPPLEGALRAINPSPRLYGEAANSSALVAFAAAEFEEDGIPGDAIAIVSGALDGIERVLREALRPGDRVAIEDPSFPGVQDLITASGWSAVPFEVDADGPVPGALERALASRTRAVIVTPRAQNPTGACITTARAGELRQRLKRFPDVVLIENDYAGPVAGSPAVTLRDAARQRWVVVRSTSKFLGPDLRLAVMAGDSLTVGRVQGRQGLGMRWVSHILQQLVLALWSDPANGRRVARAADVYTQRRTALVAALADRGIATQASSGLNLWVPVSDESRIVRALAERGWAVAAGERFRLRTPPGIRVTCSTLEPADGARFAESLAAALAPSGSGFA